MWCCAKCLQEMSENCRSLTQSKPHQSQRVSESLCAGDILTRMQKLFCEATMTYSVTFNVIKHILLLFSSTM